MRSRTVFTSLGLLLAVGCTTSGSGSVTRSASTAARRPANANPFAGARFYVDPAYRAEVERAAAGLPEAAAGLHAVAQLPTAIWLDSIAKAATVGRTLDDAATQQQATGEAVLTVFVLYDMPNRDCAAASSSGELGVPDGEARYQRDFVDVVAAAFRAHSSQRIVAILEPDSLANVATNLDKPRCAASEGAYRRAVAYALRALSLPNVSAYLDAAHAGWLGWDGNRRAMARVLADVVTAAGAGAQPRGVAINVSNYDPLVAGSGAADDNPCPDELTYARMLVQSLAEAGVDCPGVVVDTSRNGRRPGRARPGTWCNVRGAGLGERPRAAPATGIDAYFWVKPPGESDGTSDPAAPRYDPSCSTPESAPGAPQAGVFFPRYLAELVANADPPL
jgi:cellulose 1,4-beta-cellobiosidase